MTGGPDYVDVDYEAVNTGETTVNAYQLCFQPTFAPNFRDHDGTRTWFNTDKGFVRRIGMWHHINRRMWLQAYDIGETGAIGGEPHTLTGPLVATVSRDGEWVIAPAILSHEIRGLFNNREYSCLHNEPMVALQSGETIRLRQRVYFLKGSLDDLARRFAADRAAWLAAN